VKEEEQNSRSPATVCGHFLIVVSLQSPDLPTTAISCSPGAGLTDGSLPEFPAAIAARLFSPPENLHNTFRALGNSESDKINLKR